MINYIFRLARRCSGVVNGALYGLIKLPNLDQYFDVGKYSLETPVEGIGKSRRRSFRVKGLFKKITAH